MANEIPVLIDPSLGVDPAELKKAWDADADATQMGRLETRPSSQQFPGLLELVVIPVVVGVTVKVTSDLIAEAIKKLFTGKPVTVEKQPLPGGQEAVVVKKT